MTKEELQPLDELVDSWIRKANIFRKAKGTTQSEESAISYRINERVYRECATKLFEALEQIKHSG